MDYSK